MKRLKNGFMPAIVLILIMTAVFEIKTGHFISLQNLGVILRQAAPLLALSCGQTIIVLTQGTDLSLGSIVSLTSVLWILLLNLNVPMAPAILIVLCTGALCGLLNGLLVAAVHVPVFIVTLGTQNIFKSAALLLCGSMTIYYYHPVFRTVAKGTFLFLTWSSWIAILCYALTLFMLRKTRFGYRIKALGGNPRAITLSGGSIGRSQILAFVYAGIMAGIAGLLMCCRIESGNPNSGNGMEFSAVAAVLLGGTSLREGRGGVEGTIVGVLLLQVLKTGLMQAGISSFYQNAVIGVVTLGAILFDALFRRWNDRQEVMAP